MNHSLRNLALGAALAVSGAMFAAPVNVFTEDWEWLDEPVEGISIPKEGEGTDQLQTFINNPVK